MWLNKLFGSKKIDTKPAPLRLGDRIEVEMGGRVFELSLDEMTVTIGQGTTAIFTNYKNIQSMRIPTTSAWDITPISAFSESEAEEILRQMREILSTYGGVTVSDLYEIVDIPAQYRDGIYGWTSLDDAKIVPLKDKKYAIVFPDTVIVN